MNVLVIDIGGTNAKLWLTGAAEKLKIPSGKELRPKKLIDETRRLLGKQRFDRVSIGYPGDVVHGRLVKDPYNLGPGWVDFDFAGEFECPVRLMNDASMQALGSYEGGRMLYMGLGTGVGTVFVSDGKIVPLALGHLLFENDLTFSDALSRPAVKKFGLHRWTSHVRKASETLKAAFLADYVMIGGGNAKKIDAMPQDCRRGSNFNAFIGGLRMWEDALHLNDYFPEQTDPREHAGPIGVAAVV